MIVYPCDRKMNVLGMVANRSIAGIAISDDKRTEELEYGSTVLSLDISYNNEYRSKAKDLFKVGNYLLVHYTDKDDYYTIIDREDDYKNNSINLYCENCGLDLLNEIAGAYEADAEYNIAHYINKYLYDTGFEIKINELGDSIKKRLSFSGGETLTSRILSTANEFEAEIDYSFEIDKLSVVHKYINIYKKRGNEDQNVELRLNREIDNIICTESISELVTAFSMVTGGTPEGQNDPINLINYNYDDGDIYVEKSSGWVFSRKGLENWSRYLSETGTDVGHIVGTFSYDTTDQKTLCDKTVEELKKKAKPKTEYDIELSYLPDNVRVGDTVLVSDEDGNTYFTARLTKIESSDTNKEVTVTFGDFETKEPTISQQLKDLADQFNKVVQQRPLYTWFAYADDVEGNGISLEPGDKKYLGVAYNKLQEEVDISDPSIFTWSLIQGPQGDKGDTGEAGSTGPQGPQGEKGDKGDTGPQGPKGEQGDIGPQGPQGPQGIKGPSGENGQTTYFHIKYSSVANPTTPNQISDTPNIYIGTYVDFNQVDSNDPDDYTWSRFQGLQGEQGTQGIPGQNGDDGKTSYLHIKYSDNGTSFTANNGETPGKYIGTYVDFNQTDSTTFSDYTWVKIEGPQGIQGPKGDNGIQYYTWLKYADTPTSGMSDDPAGKDYIGLAYNKTTPTESSKYSDYTWSKIKGEKGDQGIQGPSGENGQTLYTWVKYATSASGANMSDNPTNKTYIGLAYNKTTATESNNANDYQWSLIKGDKGDKGDTGEQGPQGDKGETGDTGPQGPQGDKGDIGETGPQGPKGDKGDKGEQGDTGPQGPQGPQGQNGRTYTLESDSIVIKRTINGDMIPNTVTFSSYYAEGTSASRFLYSGRFVIEEDNGTGYIKKYTSNIDENTKQFTPSDTTKMIKCTLYASGGTSKSLAIQTVTVIDDAEAAVKSDTPPENTEALWFDTTSDLLKYYNGTEWVVANDYANDLNDMKQEITKEYSSSLDKLNDSISSLVTELQTVKTDNETSVNQLSSQILQNSDSISLVTNEINNVVDNISGMATKEEISQWARFQNGIIELGASNSPFAVKISATELGFYQNGIRIAYLSNQQLNISQAVVMKQIDLQPFQIITDATLGLIIK